MNVATGQSILIIESDRTLRQQMEALLRQEGFVTAAAASGQEALLLAAAAPPALMLLDLQLEDMAVREFFRRRDQFSRRVPFVIIASQEDTRAAVEMMKQGALDCAVKDRDFPRCVPEVARRALERVERETARKQAEIRHQIQSATTRVLAEADTLAEAASKVLQVVVHGLNWDLGEFWTVNVVEQVLECVDLWQRPELPETETVGRTRSLKFAWGIGLPGAVWAARAPIWIADLSLDARCTRPELVAKLGFKSAFAFPVHLRQDVLGVLQFFSRELRPLDEAMLQACAALGSQIGQFSERKRAEAALKREHAFISAVLNTCGGLVVVLDRQGRIIRFNRACESTTGYSFQEIRERPFWDIFLVADELEAVKGVFHKLSAGQFPSQYENHWLTKDGHRRLIAWSNTVLLDHTGAVEYIICTGIDTTERKRLEKEILEISDREQRRIGQDLHDGLCQHLAATELMSQVLEQRLEKILPAEAAGAAEIGRHVREAISQTRLLARGLSPVTLESEGLMSALEELAADTEQMFHVRCRFEARETVRTPNHASATHLFRIAQEAVSNALKHGKATRIDIELKPAGEFAELIVRNNGIGFPKKPKKTGMGLRIMNYRAGMIGATLRVEPGKDQGTAVICTFKKKL